MNNKYDEIWIDCKRIQILPWNKQCSIHTHIYFDECGSEELVFIEFINEEGNLVTKNNMNFKIRRDYIKVLSK